MSFVFLSMRRAMIALFALVLLLAGCGSGDDQPAATGDITTTTADTGEDGFADSTTTTEAPPAAECSASALPDADTAGSADLEDAVAELRLEIVEAALACDFDTLEQLAMDGEGEFNYSFGAPTGGFAAHLQAREDAGEPVAMLLVETLRLPSAQLTDADPAIVTWPSVNAPDASEEDWAALADVYSPDEIQAWRQAGSFLGYRVGITVEGDWIYFVAGD